MGSLTCSSSLDWPRPTPGRWLGLRRSRCLRPWRVVLRVTQASNRTRRRGLWSELVVASLARDASPPRGSSQLIHGVREPYARAESARHHWDGCRNERGEERGESPARFTEAVRPKPNSDRDDRRGHEASIVESSVTARSRDAWWHASQGFSSANTTLSTCASGAATIARHSSSSQSERTSRSWLQQPRRHRCCSRTRRARRSTRQLAAGRRRHRLRSRGCSSRPWLQMSSARRLSYGRAEAAIARAVPADGPLGAYCKRWVPAGWRGLPSSSKSSPRIAVSPVVSRPERGSAVCLSELAAVCEAGTRSSGRRPVRYRVTANSCQSSGTPFSVWLPRLRIAGPSRRRDP